MPFPFFDFINTIGADADAFDAFVADPDAAPLTAIQIKVLLSGNWDEIERLVRIENPHLIDQENATKIGWNMRVVGDMLLALHKSPGATL